MLLYPRGCLCWKYVLVIISIILFQSYEMFEIYLNDSNKKTIIDECTKYQGRLLTYEDMSSTRSQERVMELLQEGESARISGVPGFFKFISYHGCYSVTDLQGVKNISLQKQLTLNHCVDECSDDKRNFAGILNKQCFCFGRDILEKKDHKSISATDCAETRTALFYDNVTLYAHNQLVVYSVPTNSAGAIKTPLETQHTFKQCNFVQRNDDKYISTTNAKIIKRSCSDKGDLNGFICYSASIPETCNGEHERLIEENFCIVDKVLPYIEAETYCDNKGQHLSSQVLDRVFKHLEDTSVYLLNEFQNFQIFERTKDYSKNSNCVSVRKSVDILLVEAYKCSVEMPTLCYHETDKTAENASSEVNGANVTERMSDIHTCVDNHTSEKKPEIVVEQDSKTTDIPTIIGVCAGCVVFVAIILTVIIKRLVEDNRIDTEPNPPETNVDNDIDLDRYHRDPLVQGSDTPRYESAYPYYSVDSNEPITSGSQTEYEHVEGIGDTDNNVGVPSPNIYNTTGLSESDYNEIGQRKKNTTTCGRFSAVYNHIPDDRDDEYDSCINRSVQIVDTSQVYNTLSANKTNA